MECTTTAISIHCPRKVFINSLSLTCTRPNQAQPSGLIRKTQPKNSPSSVRPSAQLGLRVYSSSLCSLGPLVTGAPIHLSLPLVLLQFNFIIIANNKTAFGFSLSSSSESESSPAASAAERTLLSSDIPENMCNNTRVPITITSRWLGDKCPLSLWRVRVSTTRSMLHYNVATHLPLHRHIGRRMDGWTTVWMDATEIFLMT